MPKSLNPYPKRLKFPVGAQRLFLETIQYENGWTTDDLASRAGVHPRTLRDWKREKFSMSLEAANKLIHFSEASFPDIAVVREPFWYVDKAARNGWRVTKNKYGRIPVNETSRKKGWRTWWEAEGRHKKNSNFLPVPIRRPKKSPALSELVGILIGDGGLSPRQVTVTLHVDDDAEYAVHVASLIESLFDVVPSVYKDVGGASVQRIVVSRTELVVFCKERLGLKVGNKLKQGLDIPEWVLSRDSFKIGCLRGLIDTDGCIFNECHSVKSKKYCYPRLSFVSASPSLCRSVFTIFSDLNLHPTYRGKRKVQIEDYQKILDYFSLVGTNNPKHLRRFREFTRRS